MTTSIDALKKLFREGQHAQAIAGCEALCEAQPANLEARRLAATMHLMTRNYGRALELLLQVREAAPDDGDVLFNIGMCERELQNFVGAAQHFQTFTVKFPGHPDGWASLADCRFHLGAFDEAIRHADKAIALQAGCVPAWATRGNAQKALGQFEAALASFAQAIRLAPQLAELYVSRGDIFQGTGQTAQAADDYKAALQRAPKDDATLKKATICLLELDRGPEAIALCREVLKTDPDNLTAKLGAEWLLSQQVPLWHVPMMNEQERNQAFYDGLTQLVTPEKTVFEIGTGGGLLAMMSAKLGAAKVFTCEAVPLIAQTAVKIVARNGFQDRVTVLAKPSHEVEVGRDMPGEADILVHEIFSSELLGEHVLPAIEDAKARLLKPGGEVLPCAASIMFALVGGDALGRNLHVDDTFGFDMRDFNAIHPKKRPVYREDLEPVLLSDAVEAFRFDFARDNVFPAQRKRIDVPVTKEGRCYGVIQWIRIELAPGVFFENHPSQRREVSNWQHTVYGFDEPLQCKPGSSITVNASHDRSRPWFEQAQPSS